MAAINVSSLVVMGYIGVFDKMECVGAIEAVGAYPCASLPNSFSLARIIGALNLVS
jgi:hypothetical protein